MTEPVVVDELPQKDGVKGLHEHQTIAVPWQELKKGEYPQMFKNVSSNNPSNPSRHFWRYWSWVTIKNSTWSPLVFAARPWWLEAMFQKFLSQIEVVFSFASPGFLVTF